MQSKVLDYISGENHRDTGIIRIDYSPYALNQTRLIEQNGINDQAVRRRKETGISIDGIESLDLDDAIWVEKTKKGYVVFVHISDVTEAIPIYSPLDIEALKRTTSVYRGEGVLNMVPPALSQHLLSLNENGEKLTLTMRIELDEDAQIENFEVYESTFKNLKRYDYETFIDDYLEPESENHEVLQLMYEVAKKRKIIRTREGADLSFRDDDRQLFIGKHNEKEHFSRKKISSTIIEEFMILANITSAMISVKHGYNSIFRSHSSMEERALYQVGVGFHTGLALQNYTHFTSPIRRYADMVVHRVLKIVHLRGEAEPYSIAEISDISQYINISRALIDILGKDADIEMRGKKMVWRLKEKNGDDLNISHFTQSIRENVSSGKKIPKVIVEQIIKDLEHGDKSNWAWAIGVLLVSKNDEIKKSLKKVLLDDKKFSAKAILSLLSVTKITKSDEDYLFKIVESDTGSQYKIEVRYDGKIISEHSEMYLKTRNQNQLFSPGTKFYQWFLKIFFQLDLKEEQDAIGVTRKQVLRKIIEYFCEE